MYECKEILNQAGHIELVPTGLVVLLLLYVYSSVRILKRKKRKYESLALISFLFSIFMLAFSLFAPYWNAAECAQIDGVLVMLHSLLIFIPLAVWGYILRHYLMADFLYGK